MLSVLNSLWIVFRHMFRARGDDSVSRTEALSAAALARPHHPVARPRRRRALRGCYLCAVACPVGCIALQATEDEHGRWYPGVLPDQLLALHLLRPLRGSLPDLRDPAHARTSR